MCSKRKLEDSEITLKSKRKCLELRVKSGKANTPSKLKQSQRRISPIGNFTIKQKSYEEVIKEKIRAAAKNIKKSFLTSDVKRMFRLIMLVWSPTHVIRPDVIATFISEFEPKVKIREWWSTIPGTVNSPSIFGGMIVTFPSKETFSKVAKALSVSFRHLKLISAYKMLKFIFESESEHSICGLKKCELTVRGRCLMNVYKCRQKFEEIFSKFGKINNIIFSSDLPYKSSGIICTLHFTYATQGYAAKLHLDGVRYGHSSREKMFIEIKEDEYEKQIMKMVKRKCIQFLEQTAFVDV